MPRPSLGPRHPPGAAHPLRVLRRRPRCADHQAICAARRTGPWAGPRPIPECLCGAKATPEGLCTTSRGFQPPDCQVLWPQPPRRCPMRGRSRGPLAGADAPVWPWSEDRPSLGQPRRGSWKSASRLIPETRLALGQAEALGFPSVPAVQLVQELFGRDMLGSEPSALPGAADIRRRPSGSRW